MELGTEMKFAMQVPHQMKSVNDESGNLIEICDVSSTCVRTDATLMKFIMQSSCSKWIEIGDGSNK